MATPRKTAAQLQAEMLQNAKVSYADTIKQIDDKIEESAKEMLYECTIELDITIKELRMVEAIYKEAGYTFSSYLMHYPSGSKMQLYIDWSS